MRTARLPMWRPGRLLAAYRVCGLADRGLDALDGFLGVVQIHLNSNKWSPSFAAATPVLPRPRNGSVSGAGALEAMQQQALLGALRRIGRRVRTMAMAALDGLIGMNQVLPRQRLPSPDVAQRLMLDGS